VKLTPEEQTQLLQYHIPRFSSLLRVLFVLNWYCSQCFLSRIWKISRLIHPFPSPSIFSCVFSV
jgi:hypothetical protein